MIKGEWVKSSRSNGTGGSNCVAVMHIGHSLYVKNSKELAGAKLAFTEDEWKAFIEGVKNGEFDI